MGIFHPEKNFGGKKEMEDAMQGWEPKSQHEAGGGFLGVLEFGWVPSQSLTRNLKMAPWNRRFLLETIIFRFHVKLGEGSRFC